MLSFAETEQAAWPQMRFYGDNNELGLYAPAAHELLKFAAGPLQRAATASNPGPGGAALRLLASAKPGGRDLIRFNFDDLSGQGLYEGYDNSDVNFHDEIGHTMVASVARGDVAAAARGAALVRVLCTGESWCAWTVTIAVSRGDGGAAGSEGSEGWLGPGSPVAAGHQRQCDERVRHRRRVPAPMETALRAVGSVGISSPLLHAWADTDSPPRLRGLATALLRAALEQTIVQDEAWYERWHRHPSIPPQSTAGARLAPRARRGAASGGGRGGCRVGSFAAAAACSGRGRGRQGRRTAMFGA